MQSVLGTRAQEVSDALNSKRRVENELADVSADRKVLVGEIEQLKVYSLQLPLTHPLLDQLHSSSLEEQRNAQRSPFLISDADLTTYKPQRSMIVSSLHNRSGCKN